MSFWVISAFNFSVFYEQRVNQDPATTASCKGLINRRFMGQWQRKAVEMDNEMRFGSQGAGAGSRIFPRSCLLRAPAGVLVLQGLESWLGGQAGPGQGLWFSPRIETHRPKVKGTEPSLGSLG